MRGGSARAKAMRKRAPEEVVPVALMGASLSSGKDSSSSLRKTKGSRSTQLGKPPADMATLRSNLCECKDKSGDL